MKARLYIDSNFDEHIFTYLLNRLMNLCISFRAQMLHTLGFFVTFRMQMRVKGQQGPKVSQNPYLNVLFRYQVVDLTCPGVKNF